MKFSLVLILHLCVVMIHGVQSYDSHRKHYPKKKGFHHHGGHQSKVNTKSKLLFPSGKSYAVVTPYGSGSSRCPGRPTYVKLTSKSRRWKKEYDIVKNELQKNMKVPAGTTFGGFRVIKIDKVINPCLWQKYKYRKDQVHNEAKTVNEKMLFHAAPHPYTSAKRGLDERYSTLEKGNYGAGLYFSDGSYKAHLSAKGNKDGTKILMLCRVMLGKVQVHTDAAVNKLAHPPVGFQSVAAVNGEVSEYVIYRGEQPLVKIRIALSRFGSTFTMRTAKEWNTLPASVFPDQYNLDAFKARVNRLFLDRHAPSFGRIVTYHQAYPDYVITYKA